MKIRVLYTFWLIVPALFSSDIASAELSVMSKWRIEQSVNYCEKNNNALTYSEYWQDSVTDANRETVCIAEQFVRRAVAEGDTWLETKAAGFIKECKTKSDGDEDKYYKCLNIGLKRAIKQLSPPCRELGAEGLWDKDRCENLLSFMFMRKFEKVMRAHRSVIKKMMDVELLKFLFDPVIAIICLVLFVLDIVVFTDRGNWMRISRFGFIIGTIILVSCFFEGEHRFLSSGVAVVVSVAAIIWNHLRLLIINPDKKK